MSAGGCGASECFLKTCPPGKPSRQPESKDEKEESVGLQKIKHPEEHYHQRTDPNAAQGNLWFKYSFLQQYLMMSLFETCTTCKVRGLRIIFLFIIGMERIKNMEDSYKEKNTLRFSFLTFQLITEGLFPTSSIESKHSLFYKALLTHFRHLRHRSYKGSIWKFRRIVIDVLYFDDEFRLWFQGLLCVAVQGLRMQDIMWFPFSIQALRGMDISCYFINDEYSPTSFPVQDVPDRSIAFIWVWVKLQGKPESVWIQRKWLMIYVLKIWYLILTFIVIVVKRHRG